MKQPMLRPLVKKRVRAFLVVSACSIATIVVAGIDGVPHPRAVLQSQARPAPRPVQKVRSVSEVRAVSAEDRALAKYFDKEGPSLLEVQSMELLSGRNEMPPEAPPPPWASVSAATTAPDPVLSFVCGVDAIVVGQAVASRAFLNQSETFLITTYTVAVSDWVKPRGGSGTINVALLGGEVLLGERKLSASAAAAPLLALNTPVLLFVKRVPGAPHTFALHTPAVRIVDGDVLEADLPPVETLGKTRKLHDMAARLRDKQLSCGRQ